ncbi:protein-tyrosine phosphatase-like protein [Roridomyces roridus]|uniref:Protein-tyrosine phosphatase-like protein n=1 Tax=Roridomyces roridus TaxID=1738132 RepID=A0AAD7C540_9AGAR|nr:protein-tyrosine phosphatase-like protein [Roridomyces roridus]
MTLTGLEQPLDLASSRLTGLEPLDPALLEQLTRLPFVKVDGVINIRDLGGLPSEHAGNLVTKPRLMYRSAELSGVTAEGKEQLKQLGISRVFDLRSDTEIEKYNTPLPEIDGVAIEHVPVFKKDDYSPEVMAKRFQLYASGKTEAFMELYSQILDTGAPAFGTILRHVRDKPDEGFLFHCTAGKDRTGVIAAILLKLAGVNNDLIAKDYALTRVGREPARAMIMSRLQKEPIFQSNNEAALNMFSCHAETMTAFLEMLDSRYSGVETYVKTFGLSDEDIATIRRNILVPRSTL